jgi:hypothetical protein
VLPIDITATLLRGSKNGGVNYPTEHLTDSFTPINTPINTPPHKMGYLTPAFTSCAARQAKAVLRFLLCLLQAGTLLIIRKPTSPGSFGFKPKTEGPRGRRFTNDEECGRQAGAVVFKKIRQSNDLNTSIGTCTDRIRYKLSLST